MPDLPLRDAADYLGVSVDTVRRRVKRGELRSHKDVRGWQIVTVPERAALPGVASGMPPADTGVPPADPAIPLHDLAAALDRQQQDVDARLATLHQEMDERLAAMQDARPEEPSAAEAALRAEVDRLRDELAHARVREADTRGRAEGQARLVDALERELAIRNQQFDAEQTANAELRRLLLAQGQGLLPEPPPLTPAPGYSTRRPRRPSLWERLLAALRTP